jgi:hypothetical protein
MKTPTYLLPLLAIFTVLTFSAAAEEAELLDFELVNGTGWAIKEIYISPSAVDNWQKNILAQLGPMSDGQSLPIEFSPDSNTAKWDMKIVWVDEGEDVVWQNLDLSNLSKLTLRYNADTDETSAEAE